MVMLRWVIIGILTLITTIVWYVAKNQISQPATYKKLIGLLVLADIGVASYYVYLTRGMASKAVMLFTIPIIVSAVLARRSALLATAVLSIIAYILTCVGYFVFNFNEGYKVELYGEIGFYSAIFIVVAVMIWTFVRRK